MFSLGYPIGFESSSHQQGTNSRQIVNSMLPEASTTGAARIQASVGNSTNASLYADFHVETQRIPQGPQLEAHNEDQVHSPTAEVSPQKENNSDCTCICELFMMVFCYLRTYSYFGL